jgi:hypothetical protein
MTSDELDKACLALVSALGARAFDRWLDAYTALDVAVDMLGYTSDAEYDRFIERVPFERALWHEHDEATDGGWITTLEVRVARATYIARRGVYLHTTGRRDWFWCTVNGKRIGADAWCSLVMAADAGLDVAHLVPPRKPRPRSLVRVNLIARGMDAPPPPPTPVRVQRVYINLAPSSPIVSPYALVVPIGTTL